MLSDISTVAVTKPFYGWISLSMGGLILFIAMGSIYSFQLFLPVLCREFGWSRGMVGGSASISMIITGLSAPFAGMIIGKYGARASVITGNIIMFLGMILLSYQSALWHLILGAGILVGLGGGFGQVVPATALANNWFKRKRSLALSIINSAGSVGGFVMLPIATGFMGIFGWRATYLLLAVMIAICAVILPGIFIKNNPEDIGQVPDGNIPSVQAEAESGNVVRGLYNTPVDFTIKEAIKTRALWVLIFLNIGALFIMSMLLMHQVAFLESIGIKGMVAATAAGLFGGMGVIGNLVIGFLGLRINMRILTIGSISTILLGLVILLFAKTLPMVFLYNIVMGTGIGAFMTGFMGVCSSYYGRTNFPQIFGFTMPLGTLLGSSGAMLAGVLYDKTGSYTIPFILGVIIMSACLVLLILAPPPKHPSLKD